MTTNYVELIRKKEFADAALNLEYETFIVYIAFFSFTPLVMSLSFILLNIGVHPFRRTQISNLIVKEAPTKVSNKYVDFADVFFLDLMSKLPKHTKINDHAIELVND